MAYDPFTIDNLPNRLTLFRIALIPIVMACLYLEKMDWWYGEWGGTIAGLVFALASVTDFIDGHIARKRNMITAFGSFLDPIADKFLVVSSLVMLLALGRVEALVVVTLILREFYMTSLRLLASREGLTVPVAPMGKWKTATQLVGIPLLMGNLHFWGFSTALLGTVCIYIATLLSLYSALSYSVGLVKKLQLKRQQLKEKRAKK